MGASSRPSTATIGISVRKSFRKEIEEKIEKYLADLDRGDVQEAKAQEAGGEGLKEKIEKLKDRKGRYDELLKELERSGENQISILLKNPHDFLLLLGLGRWRTSQSL